MEKLELVPEQFAQQGRHMKVLVVSEVYLEEKERRVIRAQFVEGSEVIFEVLSELNTQPGAFAIDERIGLLKPDMVHLVLSSTKEQDVLFIQRLQRRYAQRNTGPSITFEHVTRLIPERRSARKGASP
jgi:hypothetical protein